MTEWLASHNGPTSVQDLRIESLEYGYRFGDWRRGIRHGDWWAWFGTDAGSDEAVLRILSQSDRGRWLRFDAKSRAQFILRLLRDCVDPMPDFVLAHHYLEQGMTYRSVTYLLAREVFDAISRTNFNSMEIVDESAEATMDDAYLDTVVDYLFMRGVELGPGLKDNEVDAIERRCAFRFPPDLRTFLQRVHPLGRETPPPNAIVTGGPFPNWRNAPDDYIQLRFEGVLHGICFDIEHGFWNPAWGTQPPDIADACDVARQELAKAPTLIPVFAHRFMPNEPLETGNPVFSFHQTDIIYYGFNLPHYFRQEFGVPLPNGKSPPPKVVRVWTGSLDWRDNEFWPCQ